MIMEKNIPLAERMRPVNLDEIKGQDKLLAKGTLLRQMLDTGEYSSFILWGPPGCGKTTIAKLIEQNTQNDFIPFSAVLSGIKEVKEVMQEANYHFRVHKKRTILFIDEIHRFNKSQQDAFLPYVESGAIILIGATTENPSFEVIPALMSRCHTFVLDMLNQDSLEEIIKQAVIKLGLKSVSSEIITYIADVCGGDGRQAMNYLEAVIPYLRSTENPELEAVSKILTRKAMFYDKDREEHYNLISALHKSLRSSDAQAGLYWLARMLEAGEEPLYLVRRLVRFASEDIGLADPNALVQAIAVKETIQFLGMPESNVALTQLVVYLATAPKSNACYIAYKKAAVDAVKSSNYGVPLHLRNAPTKLMKDLGYSKDYKYAHEFKNAYTYQKCFPEQMEEQTYYEPSVYGFEKEISKRLIWWDKLKKEEKEE
ncbi:MAG: replication-associated recombination protein A [Candidatus Cloacimonetes bacterium]|nr:replication-associated recombination protein A [Candidatus Cloacimonadota bacterium]